MEKIKRRIHHMDGDILEVFYHYDEAFGQYFGKFPDFIETPRYTPNGRPWVNVTIVGCPYADERYNDCGSCQYLKKEHPMDLIGVCQNDNYRIKNMKSKKDA